MDIIINVFKSNTCNINSFFILFRSLTASKRGPHGRLLLNKCVLCSVFKVYNNNNNNNSCKLFTGSNFAIFIKAALPNLGQLLKREFASLEQILPLQLKRTSQTRPEVIKLFPCSIQLSMKVYLQNY